MNFHKYPYSDCYGGRKQKSIKSQNLQNLSGSNWSKNLWKFEHGCSKLVVGSDEQDKGVETC